MKRNQVWVLLTLGEANEKNNSWAGKLIKQLFSLLVILLFPAILFDYLLQNYEEERVKLGQISELSEAKIAMARLQREMNLEKVVETALRSFIKDSIPYLQMHEKSANSIEFLEKKFFQRFSKNAELTWFNENFKIVASQLEHKVINKTAWEKFIKAIVCPQFSTKTDLIIADGLVKTEMSDFLSSNFFSKAMVKPIEVLYKNKRILLRVLKLELSGTSSPKYLLIKLPIDKAKKDWLEERAMKKISTGNFQAGAFRISDQTAFAGSTISDNLLHGFSKDFWAGKSYHFYPNQLFYFSQQIGQPDVFLCVAVKRFGAGFSSLRNFYSALKCLIYLPFFLTLLLTVSGKIDFNHLGLSLRTRFKLATTGLTVIPIALMAILGTLYSAQVKIELEQEMIESLDNSINRFNDSVTNQTVQLETFLQTGMADLLSKDLPEQAMAEKALGFLRNSGCHLAIVFRPDGKIFTASRLKASLIRARTAFFLGFIKVPLEKENFDVTELETQTRSPVSGKFQKYNEKKFRYDFFDRLNSIEMGATVANLFSTFIRDGEGRITACICAGFDAQNMQQCFLRNSLNLNKGNETQVFLRPTSTDGTFYTPDSKTVDELLNLTALTGETFVKQIRANKKNYLIYSRMLKDIPSAAAAVMQVKENTITIQTIFTAILLIIGGLALANSEAIFRLFEKVFLVPVLLLTDSVKRIRNGDFSIRLAVTGEDELAKLKASFNSMATGLQEKSEMKNFLSEDLIVQAKDRQNVEVEKTVAAVMFCGIRNFLQIEKRTSPEEAFEIMNLFLSVCDEEVKKAGGETDKFIGETAMAFFKRNQQKNEVEMAFTAALNIKTVLLEKMKEFPERAFNFGLGVASGNLIAGHIGSLNKRLDYTVIGDPVNLAARLEKLAGRGGTPQILSTDQAFVQTSDNFSSAPTGKIQVKGKQIPINVVEILGKNRGKEF